MEYIPSGMTKEQWAKFKGKEAAKKKVGKFDGTSGMKFRSRTFEDFQKGRESGKITYNMVSAQHCRHLCLLFALSLLLLLLLLKTNLRFLHNHIYRHRTAHGVCTRKVEERPHQARGHPLHAAKERNA
jgi:hypothetical protein